jgi:hypothetical protein
MEKNIVILIHGIAINMKPEDPGVWMKKFWQDVCKKDDRLKNILPQDCLYVKWGQPIGSPPQAPTRDDQYLCDAENYAGDRTSYENVSTDSDPNNHVINDGVWEIIAYLWKASPWYFKPFVLLLVLPVLFWGNRIKNKLNGALRNQLLLAGLGDAVYYVSQEGEDQLRKYIYGAFAAFIDRYPEDEIRIHVISHSLGVTIAHDFLYGLFTKPQAPTAVSNDAAFIRVKMRTQSQSPQRVVLGSFTSFASQLPLMHLRKTKFVRSFGNDFRTSSPTRPVLNAADIGTETDSKETGKTKWNIFYDRDDPLGFPTRRLYIDSKKRIQEYQVSTGILGEAHVNYWTNDQVISKTARLIAENL